MIGDPIIRRIYPWESKGMPQPPEVPGIPPRGVNNIYSNSTIEELRVWIAKDPLCQLFAKQKAEQLELELTELRVKRILESKKAKAVAKRGERMKPHNKTRRRN